MTITEPLPTDDDWAELGHSLRSAGWTARKVTALLAELTPSCEVTLDGQTPTAPHLGVLRAPRADWLVEGQDVLIHGLPRGARSIVEVRPAGRTERLVTTTALAAALTTLHPLTLRPTLPQDRRDEVLIAATVHGLPLARAGVLFGVRRQSVHLIVGEHLDAREPAPHDLAADQVATRLREVFTDGMTRPQLALAAGISERTLRRYLPDDLAPRLRRSNSPATAEERAAAAIFGPDDAIAALTACAKAIAPDTVREATYATWASGRPDRPGSTTIARIFGGWTKAVAAAGLPVNLRGSRSEDKLASTALPVEQAEEAVRLYLHEAGVSGASMRGYETWRSDLLARGGWAPSRASLVLALPDGWEQTRRRLAAEALES